MALPAGAGLGPAVVPPAAPVGAPPAAVLPAAAPLPDPFDRFDTTLNTFRDRLAEQRAFIQANFVKPKARWFECCRKAIPPLDPEILSARFVEVEEATRRAEREASEAYDHLPAANTVPAPARAALRARKDALNTKYTGIEETATKVVALRNKHLAAHAENSLAAYKKIVQREQKFLANPKLGDQPNCTQRFKNRTCRRAAPPTKEQVRAQFVAVNALRHAAKDRCSDAIYDAFDAVETLPLSEEKQEEARVKLRNLETRFGTFNGADEQAVKDLIRGDAATPTRLSRIGEINWIHIVLRQESDIEASERLKPQEREIRKTTAILVKREAELQKTAKMMKRNNTDILEELAQQKTGIQARDRDHALTYVEPPSTERRILDAMTAHGGKIVTGGVALGATVTATASLSNALGLDPTSTVPAMLNGMSQATGLATGTVLNAAKYAAQGTTALVNGAISLGATGVTAGVEYAAGEAPITAAGIDMAKTALQFIPTTVSDVVSSALDHVNNSPATQGSLAAALITRSVAQKLDARGYTKTAKATRYVGYTTAAIPPVQAVGRAIGQAVGLLEAPAAPTTVGSLLSSAAATANSYVGPAMTTASSYASSAWNATAGSASSAWGWTSTTAASFMRDAQMSVTTARTTAAPFVNPLVETATTVKNAVAPLIPELPSAQTVVGTATALYNAASENPGTAAAVTVAAGLTIYGVYKYGPKLLRAAWVDNSKATLTLAAGVAAVGALASSPFLTGGGLAVLALKAGGLIEDLTGLCSCKKADPAAVTPDHPVPTTAA